jgi:lysine 6-dehydrogenase
MRALVLGAGRMGLAAAWDLARQPGVDVVRLVDRDEEALRGAERSLAKLLLATAPDSKTKVEAQRFDLESPDGLVRLLEGWNVALSSADYRYNVRLTRAAIDARTNLCDLGGNLFVVEQQLALDEDAKRQGVTIVPDCGLAPGLACALAAWGVERVESPETVRIRAGALPAHPKPPLAYKLVSNPRGLTNAYVEPAEALRDGKIVRLPSLTDVETIEFPYPYGTLEAFNASGGASTLPRTLKDRVRNLDYKAVRYPGHCAAFAGMHALGLLSEKPMDGVVPRELTERLIARHLVDDQDTDVVVVRVGITGKRNGAPARLVFEIIDEQDPRTGHSAMARTTSYSAATVAYMLAAGAVRGKGVLPGERALPLEAFAGAVRARGIDIAERWETP